MGKTYLVITCCIKNEQGIRHEVQRRTEYIIAIANALMLLPKDIIPIIVENSCNDGKSFLDVFKCDVLYTKDNHFEECEYNKQKWLLHKGINELRDIKKVIEKYNIQDDDMIIKLTGRYLLFQDDIFQMVLKNPTRDAFLKYYNVCTNEHTDNNMVLGFFALRCKYFKVVEYQNPEKGAEEDFVNFINDYIPKDKIVRLNKLFMRCFFGDNGKMLDV